MPKTKVAPAAAAEGSDLRSGLVKLFRQYDVDGNGHIDERELWAMLTEVVIASGQGKEGFDEADAKTVMVALDNDGNGSVEEDELVEWVLAGLARPSSERKRFAKTSAFAARLDSFLTACEMLAKRFSKVPLSGTKTGPETDSPRGARTKASGRNRGQAKQPGTKPQSIPARKPHPPGQPESKPNSVAAMINRASADIDGACDLLQLQCGLRLLFTHFNVSKDGTLDAKGVGRIFDVLPREFMRIQSICTPEEVSEISMSLPNICTQEDAPRVFNALDSDKSGSIDMDEWIQWFVAGSLRDGAKQMAFAAKSAFNLRLTVSCFPLILLNTRAYSTHLAYLLTSIFWPLRFILYHTITRS